MSAPLCGQCRTFKVPNPGDLCWDCRRRNRVANQKLIDDLKKPPKDPESK